MLKRKKKKLSKAIFSVFMVVVICLATMGSVPIKVYSAYIDPALEKILSRAEDTDLIPVDIWLYDIDTEEVDEKVFAKTGLNREIISDEKRSADLTHEQVDAYIEAERTIYAEAQTEQSEAFLNKYSNMFATTYYLNDNGGGRVMFVSQYAPVIRMELTSEQINSLSKDLSVESIYYSPNIEINAEMDSSLATVRADYSRDTLGYTGSGIKIGMIEADGLPNINLSCFNSSNIICYPNYNLSQTTAHASLVASILVSADYGIVPDATLYATFYTSGDTADWRTKVEWLLSQNVVVINMSAGFKSISNGYYDTHCNWLDHIAINHSVHFIKSSGNNIVYVSSPGLSYNALTIGNLNDNDNSAYGDDVISDNSCYVENGSSTSSRKPDLVAPGTRITTSVGTNSGTSFAAPHVTAIVAQLCQAKPALKTQQDAMKAILTASINHSVHHYEPSDANYDKYGAGVVDARSALYTINNSRYVSSSFSATAEDDSSHYYTFNVASSDTKVRISLAWLKYAYISGSNHPSSTPSTTILSDLDLLIYNSSGTCVYVSNVAAGNVEIVEMNTLSPGTYTIEVNLFDNGGSKTYYTVAWW